MAAGGWLMVTAGPARLRHEVPTEVDLAVASFKALALPTSVAFGFEEGRWSQ
jgi:hypothetical protein